MRTSKPSVGPGPICDEYCTMVKTMPCDKGKRTYHTVYHTISHRIHVWYIYANIYHQLYSYHIIPYLVGGIPTPLKNMSSSMGRMTSHIYILWKIKKNVWSHQADIIPHHTTSILIDLHHGHMIHAYPRLTFCLDWEASWDDHPPRWFQPTPLKKHGVKVSWDDDIPNMMEK